MNWQKFYLIFVVQTNMRIDAGIMAMTKILRNAELIKYYLRFFLNTRSAGTMTKDFSILQQKKIIKNALTLSHYAL